MTLTIVANQNPTISGSISSRTPNSLLNRGANLLRQRQYLRGLRAAAIHQRQRVPRRNPRRAQRVSLLKSRLLNQPRRGNLHQSIVGRKHAHRNARIQPQSAARARQPSVQPMDS